MADISNERDARMARLQTWFHMSNADGPVSEEGIQEFLNEIKEVHFTDVNGDGRAASILQNGYSSVHDIAQMTAAELRETGFLAGQAKRIGSYLGSRPRDPSPARPLPHGPISVANSAQHSAQTGAAVAQAVTTSQTKIKLSDGSANPTMGAAIKWARKHMEKSNISGFSTLTKVIRELTDDITFDITPEIIAEPVATDDATYVAEVNASLTPEQQEKFGDNQKASAVTLIQNILKNVADTKIAVYMARINAFSSFSSTYDEHAVLGRFKGFQSLFTEQDV